MLTENIERQCPAPSTQKPLSKWLLIFNYLNEQLLIFYFIQIWIILLS